MSATTSANSGWFSTGTQPVSVGPWTSAVGSHCPSRSPATICSGVRPSRCCGDPSWRSFQPVAVATAISAHSQVLGFRDVFRDPRLGLQLGEQTGDGFCQQVLVTADNDIDPGHLAEVTLEPLQQAALV